ncbi:S1C family serine protease [Aureliella helgolandensis]|uniref:S1C family serine protease n=1 Tax=Aureliella helgolandensis TaxID=2527968 RepID=UPI0018D122AF|nr:trypsin-like peptidase domain-containing protein [Aureliella helgolandensis]
MRKLCLTRRLICIALGLLAAKLNVATAHAQIVLRPSLDPPSAASEYANGDYADSSRRQRPVSREAPLSSVSRDYNQPVLPESNSRAHEFKELRAEADALSRQLTLVRRIVHFASPTIVHIEATKTAETGKGFASSRIEEAGAGVLVNVAGTPHVLTNRHVIHPADIHSIRLELNSGRRLQPTQVWTDPSTDVAIIQIAERDLVTAELGDSDAMEVGDFVLAIGSPFGLSHSVTSGILSAKGRRNLELGSKEIEIQNFFQTDAAINPGNSGGPLLNYYGQIVGINTAIASNSGGNEGIGFTIPINMAMVVAEQLVSSGRLQRAYLGVQLENAFDPITARRLGLGTNMGALVKSIIPNSPADRGGVRVGDVILEFNGSKIYNDGHLVQSVGLTPVGKSVSLVIFRNGQKLQATAVLDSSPES